MLKKILNHKNLSLLGLFIATLAWGASFFLVKKTTGEVGLWPFLWWRFALAAVLLVIMFPKKVFKARGPIIRHGCVLGSLLFLIMWTQTLGLQYTTASRSGFITSLYVPLIPLMAWLLLKQKTTIRQWLVAGVAVVGLYIMTRQEYPGGDFNPGDLWTLVCAVLCAVQIVLTERYAREHADSIALGVWQFIWCALCITGCVLWINVPMNSLLSLQKWSTSGLVALGFMVTVATCFAFIMQIVCQKTVGAFKAGLIFALEAPFATFFAFLFLNEIMTATETFGAFLVFLTSIVPEPWLKKTRKGIPHGPF